MIARAFALLACALLVTGCSAPAAGVPATGTSVATEPERRELLLATTTSFQDSGLLEDLTADFERRTGLRIRATAVGSGAAIAIGARGDADVVFAHSEAAERTFMADGHGRRRIRVMYNDFVLVGPSSDPARARGLPSLDALRAIARTGARFYSRGDKSGTDVFEKALWRKAGITPAAPWYIEAATGMGQTLRVASEKEAYTLTDRGTFLARRATLALVIVVERDPPLINPYHVMTVDPAKHPRVNARAANLFADYLVSPEGQARIGRFGVDRFGEPLFTPDARP